MKKLWVNVGAGVAIEKDHDSALSYLESKIKELEVALQETNAQRQQIAANLEQGKQTNATNYAATTIKTTIICLII